MWISEKKWKELSDENSALKQRVKDMEVLNMAVEHANSEGKRNVYNIGGSYYLVGIDHYFDMVNSLHARGQEAREADEEVKHYKQLYLDELQKRLELADRVRELEGK